MNNHITFNLIAQRYNQAGLKFDVLNLQNDYRIIVTQRGGRIFGPFLGEDGESILWANECHKSRESFEEFIYSGQDWAWNVGGDRVWIAPELQYNSQDRQHFFEKYKLPEQIDPGGYTLKKISGEECVLEQNMSLKTFNPERGEKKLFIKREIKKAENPLNHVINCRQLSEGVSFCGYMQSVFLSEDMRDDISSETWSLTQINSGGRLYISCVSYPEYTDYYSPVGAAQSIDNKEIKLNITGDRMYKVGYKAASVSGRMAYLNDIPDGKTVLIVRQMHSDPAAHYVKEPADKPGNAGHSLHIYNDDGQMGGFAEIECSGHPIGANTGKISSIDEFYTWVYEGEKDKIVKIMNHLI